MAYSQVFRSHLQAHSPLPPILLQDEGQTQAGLAHFQITEAFAHIKGDDIQYPVVLTNLDYLELQNKRA